MRRAAAVEAEVARGLDQAAPKCGLPEPVGDDPGEERVARAGDPPGQAFPAVGLGGVGRETEVGIGPGATAATPPAGDTSPGCVGVAADLEIASTPAGRGETA